MAGGGKVRRVSGSLGAELKGLDRRTVDDEGFALLREALLGALRDAAATAA